jgi:sugar fermentation stimulation protein A
MTFIVDGEIFPGTFINRINRFAATVNVVGKDILCHLPNPGRMVELLIPNQSQVYIRYPLGSASHRRTKATLVGVISDDNLIQLDSTLVAKWLPEEFIQNNVPGLLNYSVVRNEPRMGKHRFDFILQSPDGFDLITEVKSTTRVIDKVACFPDAVSRRATSQTMELIRLTSEGHSCMIIFIVQGDAESFAPCSTIDPTYASAFRNALRSKVRILALLSHARIINIASKHYIELSLTKQLSISTKY